MSISRDPQGGHQNAHDNIKSKPVICSVHYNRKMMSYPPKARHSVLSRMIWFRCSWYFLTGYLGSIGAGQGQDNSLALCICVDEPITSVELHGGRRLAYKIALADLSADCELL
jgi:hypothetical protein